MIAPGFESHQCLAGMWKRRLGCHSGCQKVGRCCTRGESQGMCNVTHTPPLSSNKAEPTLALKPRGHVTRSPKQEYQWPHKKDSYPPKNPEETSPEVQNRSISGPTKRTHILQKILKNKNYRIASKIYICVFMAYLISAQKLLQIILYQNCQLVFLQLYDMQRLKLILQLVTFPFLSNFFYFNRGALVKKWFLFPWGFPPPSEKSWIHYCWLQSVFSLHM